MEITLLKERAVPYGYLDVTGRPHDAALEASREAISQMPGQRIVVVDLDGPILLPQGFRIGLSVGELSERAKVFLEGLEKDSLNEIIVYSSRPLRGAFAQFLNRPGVATGRMLDFLSFHPRQEETLLLIQLAEEIGVPRQRILYPQGLKAVVFPFFKWGGLARLMLGKQMCLSEKLQPGKALVYLGDTKADEKIFRQLVKRLRASDSGDEVRDLFIKFRSFCLGSLF